VRPSVLAWADRRRLGRALACAAGLAASPAAFALDLLESYQLALQNEPAYQAARAAADATREVLPQARAQLLPSIQGSASISQATTTRTVEGQRSLLNPTGQDITNDFNYLSTNYALTLRQPLFRMQSWATYQQAKEQVAGAEATLQQETQSLGDRVASAYFNALFAEDHLASILAQKEAYQGQLNAARRNFDAGLGTRTDIDEAQARYDFVVAQEIEGRQNVDFTRQQIEKLINQPVDGLAKLDSARLDLNPIQPSRLEEWIAKAEKTNPELIALQHGLEAARQEVAKSTAGHYPTVDAFAQVSKANSDTNVTINQKYDTAQVGVQVVVPIFSGGYVNSRVRQAVAATQQAEQELEAARLTLQLNVRKQFQYIVEGVAKIRALENARHSAEQSLLSNQKGFRAGIRASVDVLNAIMQQAMVENDLAQARYEYSLARLRLMSLVGELDFNVISAMNQWLAKG
jgi:protease secretion system outer membrane protein